MTPQRAPALFAAASQGRGSKTGLPAKAAGTRQRNTSGKIREARYMLRESARIGVQLMDSFKPIGRRRFVQGLAGSALLLAQGRGRALAAASAPSELIGPDFHLTID